MWQFVTSSRKRIKARHISPRRTRLYRPDYTPLEDRCLLSVSLSGSEPPVPLVGSPVTWTATASGHGPTPVYQFRVGATGGASQMIHDFSPGNTFTWNPMQQGSYDIQVTVKDSFGSATGESATATYRVDSRVVGTSAVVSPTSNPLVALYSAPPSAGSSMHVEFKPLGSNQSWSRTSELPIVPGESTNFLVAGMLPNTTYLMRHVLNDGTVSAPLTFTTGSLPTSLTFPTFTVQQPPAPGTNLTQNTVFHFGIGAAPNIVTTVATDLKGNIEWYYDPVANHFNSFGTSLVPGGTVLLLGGTPRSSQGGETRCGKSTWPATPCVRRTSTPSTPSWPRWGSTRSLTSTTTPSACPTGTRRSWPRRRGPSTSGANPLLYNGDMVIVLDQNFQVAWVWDPFNCLNTHRLPTLGEGPSDWMHANSIAWSPADGNLVVSLRNLDWVIKIDYANGTGDGHVIWRLGQGGDFRINSTDPSPWFSHQHDVTYINDTTLVLFDNGNTRRSKNRRADSRGQELVLDEKTRVATLVVNADLGNYASYTGGAQMLPSGNLNFDSPLAEQTIEVLPNGSKSYVLKMNMPGVQYRSYTYSSLYGNPANTSLPSTPIPPRLARRLAILERRARRRQALNRPGVVAGDLYLHQPEPRGRPDCPSPRNQRAYVDQAADRSRPGPGTRRRPASRRRWALWRSGSASQAHSRETDHRKNQPRMPRFLPRLREIGR